jgi:hypothetical protein
VKYTQERSKEKGKEKEKEKLEPMHFYLALGRNQELRVHVTQDEDKHSEAASQLEEAFIQAQQEWATKQRLKYETATEDGSPVEYVLCIFQPQTHLCTLDHLIFLIQGIRGTVNSIHRNITCTASSGGRYLGLTIGWHYPLSRWRAVGSSVRKESIEKRPLAVGCVVSCPCY